MNTARDRAEELLTNLQKRARELLDAEEGLARTVRDLVDETGVSTQEVRKRLEDLLGRIKANKVWDNLRGNEKVVALGDYRDELERQIRDNVERFWGSLPVATKGDLDELSGEIKELREQVANLSRPA